MANYLESLLLKKMCFSILVNAFNYHFLSPIPIPFPPVLPSNSLLPPASPLKPSVDPVRESDCQKGQQPAGTNVSRDSLREGGTRKEKTG